MSFSQYSTQLHNAIRFFFWFQG